MSASDVQNLEDVSDEETELLRKQCERLEQELAMLQNYDENEMLRTLSEAKKENESLEEASEIRDIKIYELSGKLIEMEEKQAKEIAEIKTVEAENKEIRSRLKALDAENRKQNKTIREIKKTNKRLRAENQQMEDQVATETSNAEDGLGYKADNDEEEDEEEKMDF